AAGERAAARRRAAAADVELRQQPARPAEPAPRIDPAQLGEGFLAVVVQDEVLGQVEVEHEATTVAVFGDVPHSGVERGACGGAAQIVCADANAARGGMAQAGEGVDQLRLAVPVDAGDADDL